ncbi:MAG: PorV/PorQ family protein [Calditrichaceae bacterium]|nr:PorV/PorQ family protein [Calditrichaceae bacterium]MBN2709166.1 PorV/PorQ family protein [Calditrichaceae bacterium]RQV96122.1 MAG: PorV/PorQ family protein [Calditrichota bacterium]
MMKLNKGCGFLVILVSILLVSLPLYAGDDSRIGTAAGEQVLQPIGARGVAMGGSDIVYTQGIEALHWNPAGLSILEKGFVGMFSRNTVFNDIGINYLGLGIQAGSIGVIAFDIKAFSFGDILRTTETDMDGLSGATFSPTWGTIGLTYANKLTSTIQVGIKAKIIYESLPRVSGSAFAFDIGLQYRNLAGIEGVSFGVVLKNIGTSLKYEGSGLMQKTVDDAGATYYLNRVASSDQLPTAMEIGAAYKYIVNEENNLLFTGMFQNNNTNLDAYKIGAEYIYNELIAVRAGYVMLNNPPDDYKVLETFTLGAGIKYEYSNILLQVDYAYRDYGIFDANNMFTLTVGF